METIQERLRKKAREEGKLALYLTSKVIVSVFPRLPEWVWDTLYFPEVEL
jgi:hypothetical protein